MSIYRLILPLLLVLAWEAAARPLVHHQLRVNLDPEGQRLQVQDHLTLPPELEGACLTLAAGLNPRILEPGVHLRPAPAGQGLERFCLDRPQIRRFTLAYRGHLPGPTLPTRDGPLAPISPRGVYLDGGGAWYPRFGDEQVSFRLELRLPESWRGVTQGSRHSRGETSEGVREVWQERLPQEDIYLIAGPFQEYTGATQPARALAFLRQDDPALARRYLEATAHYLDFYSRLLGPYPYAKFALVENLWESGYGMPSFTLLGPRVIRLPFILHTSYPHEILHNWWGNGVYPDYAQGNWSEGLTAYLADHLLKEQQGQGAEHRRAALQRFTDFVSESRAFPLADFRSRHDPTTQAVGYDKGLMLFHMLRLELGDQAFLAGLRRFYRQHLHQRAGFTQLRQAL
ncbi:MAG: M1 family aminopeptidase, partial [Candidatus Competibacteraceae bacterium]|nr:M1 family aminopeptidase [Candidatus Competibacteraceae bacterium]